MRREFTSLALLTLVASMIIGSIPTYVYADSQSDSLIRIATQARDHLRIQLSELDNISDELKKQFEQASADIEALKDAIKQDDVSTARQHFLSAMKAFNEISQKISERPTTEAALSASQISPNLANELDRLERYIDRLKKIATKNNIEVDFSNITELMNTARKYLNEDNSDSAYSTIDEIKRSIIEINKALKEKTRQKTTERAISFAEMHLKQLDRLIAQAQEIGISQNTIDRLIEARDNLDTASDVDQIISEVKHIISVREQFENTKEQRIKSRINQLEVKLERLSSNVDGTTEFEKAETMLADLLDLVSKGKLDDAIRMLNSLNNLITEIESSYNEVSKNKDVDSTRALDDSKIERIKLKIQKLETEMRQLAEQIEENAAAKRWLDNAFILLEDAKLQLDDSTDAALDTIMKIEQIIKRIQNTL